jgi:hypothetical protein
VIQAQVSITEMLLYDIGHSSNPAVANALTLADRLELLCNCLNATKSLLDFHFGNVDVDWQYFPSLAASDVVFGLLTSLRLLMFKLAGWDQVAARKQLRFDEILEQKACEMDAMAIMRKDGSYTKALTRLSAVGAVPPLGLDNFEKLSISLRHLKAMLHRELGLVTPDPPSYVPTSAATYLEDNFSLIADLNGPLLHDFIAEGLWFGDMNVDLNAAGMAVVGANTTTRPPW